MTDKQEILHFLQEKKSELFSDYQLIKLGLFGSFARDEATDESDIDLIVEFRPDTEDLSGKKLSIKFLLESNLIER